MKYYCPIQKKYFKNANKAKKRLAKKTWRKKLKAFASNLNINLPRSEQWFQALYKGYQCSTDLFNVQFHQKYIPDVQNRQFKYIIEIDGSVHNREDIKRKDITKDNWFRSKGYKVFRIEAYNVESFQEVINNIVALREEKGYLKPRRITYNSKSI